MTIRAFLLPFSVAALTACSSAGGSTPGRATDSNVDIYNSPTAEPIEIRNQSSVSSRTYAAPLETVWEELQEVYEELEIPLTTVQPSEGLLGNRSFRVRRIAGQDMSRFLDCGSSITGPHADQGDVTLSLFTSLQPQDGGTLVTTDVDAFVRLRSSRSTLHCVSKGRLEAIMRELLQARIDGRSVGPAGD